MTRVHAQKTLTKNAVQEFQLWNRETEEFCLWTESLRRNLRYMQTSSPSMFGHAARHRCFSLLLHGGKRWNGTQARKSISSTFFLRCSGPLIRMKSTGTRMVFKLLGGSDDFIMQNLYLLRLMPVCVGLIM
jgi:hypothetical protein